MSVPEVAVVVATYQRRDLLDACVRALLGQRGVDHEVIVVDDGSDDGTGDLLAGLAAADDRLRWFRQPRNAGAATARNRAWRAARAPLVAFTDDDCVPTPGWAAALVAAAADADVVQGPTLPNPDQVQHTYWGRSLTIRDWSRRFETCNLLVRRDLLAATDGFDERLALGEDTELGHRMLARGACTAFAPDALVHHEVWDRSFAQYLRERRRWADMVKLVAIDPQARDGMAHHWVWRYSHVAVLVGVPAGVGAIAAGWWWVPPVGIGAWAVRHAVRQRPRRPDRSVPELLGRGVQELVGLTVETAWFAANSVRHGTLLL